MEANQSIAVVVPVYNMQERLEICLESILNQTYSNLEIILINDGSSDDSPNICEEYSRKDSRIKVIHQENQGLSAARNRGIRESISDYLVFIDSDDYVGEHYVANLVFALKMSDTLLASCQFKKTNRNNLEQKQKLEDNKAIKIISSQEMLYKMLYHDEAEVSAWDKIYHRSLFNQLEFPYGEIYEDIAIMPEIVKRAKKVAVHPYTDYFNYMSENSIQRSQFSEKKMVLIRNIDRIYQDTITQREPSLIKAATYRYCDILIEFLCQINSKEFPNEKKAMWSKIVSLRKNVLKDNHPNAKKVKIAAILSFLGYGPLKSLYHLQQRLKKH
ncbi:glycosyltransferase family 2 protein [Globicatella sanguinis]|uniref:glycosyltransferase family 2 protein n=1 Tax=Globicatella sanguinis TaxID=13076 RepID=UPI00254392C8|nr:glycosyltransferase family 2 protein [Globicatella sanguinis]MDK7631108.1 glycosyltransferase [Globicatella sanguinis]WIK66112.1 glycosyltransferase [Globicatella sanguinis]WKT55517.1 glycosyltransferase [Globicatella sanguinis]